MPGYLRYIFELAFRQKRAVFALGTFLVFAVMARLTEPYLYKVVVDTLADGIVRGEFLREEIRSIGIVIASWFVLAVFMNAVNAQASYLTWRIGNQSSQTVHIEGYRRLLRLDYAEHTRKHSTRQTKTVDDADTSMWELTNWWLHRFASAGLGFLGMLVIAFATSWQMTVIALVILPPGIWFIVRHLSKYEDRQREVNKMWEEKHEHLSDQTANIVTYKLNPHEELFVGRHFAFVKRAQDAQNELNRKWRVVEMMNSDAIARFLVLGSGVFFVIQGSITIGTLFMFMGLLNEILIPLHLLGDILPQYSRRADHIRRFLEFMERKDVVTNAPHPRVLKSVRGGIVFDRVSFSYPQGAFAIRDVSFEIKPGETLALVGHSGSGKSTIAALLNRLMDPTDGRILIDGMDMKELDLEEVKSHIGTVLQENAMYNETIAENIAYGNPGATREEIVRVAKEAQAHEFIEELPKGYDTPIGERGVRLSGGEKQRVAIARAILKDPSIVILDEPTSALDSITESKIQEGLERLLQGRTALVIAHRLSTVRKSDNILVVDNGGIICRGSHEELMKICALYRQMVDLQTKGLLAEK